MGPNGRISKSYQCALLLSWVASTRKMGDVIGNRHCNILAKVAKVARSLIGVDKHMRNIPFPRPRNCWTIMLPSSGKVSFTEATTSFIDGMLKGVKSVLRSNNKLVVSVISAASSAATGTVSKAGTGALPTLQGAGEAMATEYNACGGN